MTVTTSDVAADVVELASDVSELTATSAVEAVRYVRTNPLVFVAVGVVAGAAGALVGYKIAQRKLSKEFDERLEQEIQETKDFYNTVHKTEYASPEEAVQALIPDEELQDAMREYQGRPDREHFPYDKVAPKVKVVEEVVEQTETVITSNIFEGSEWDWDHENAERARLGDEPYIITVDEFMENEPDYQQNSLTYYVEDDTLADESNEIIHDVVNILGSEELLGRFGHGSKDPRTLYIRNKRLDLDFEIVMSDRSYAVDVLGFSEEEAPKSRRRFSERGD